jgi:hypothetical protein
VADYREELALEVRELKQAVANLQQRMAALECRAPALLIENTTAGPGGEVLPAVQPATVSFAPGAAAVLRTESLAALFGWALLGLAGAYLLRAVTESGRIPGVAGAAMGILYAAWWLFLAARRAWEKPLFSAVHGLTAALILSPMLWEVTVRFRTFSAPVASAVLVLFAVWGLAIGWQRKLAAIAWIGTLAGVLTATALYRETHDAAAWSVSTLVIAAAVECCACRNRWLGLRWVVAAFADLVVLGLMFVASHGTGVTAALVMSSQAALFAIYAAGTADRTVMRRLPVAWLEIAQLVFAFSIALSGALGTNLGVPAALVCLAAGAACYWAAFGRFHRGRNYLTYSTFGIVLAAAAGWLSLSGTPLTGAAAMAAVVTTWLGVQSGHRTLRIHGAACLLLAAWAGSVFQLAAARIVQTGTVAAPLAPGYLLAAAGALLCYLAIRRREIPASEVVIPAALLCFSLVGLVAGWIPAASARTALVAGFAIAGAWCGRRWDRTELVWLIWPLLALAGVKVLLEDVHRSSVTLFLSFLSGAVALILLPRLLRQRAGVVVDNPPAVRAAAQH